MCYEMCKNRKLRIKKYIFKIYIKEITTVKVLNILSLLNFLPIARRD